MTLIYSILALLVIAVIAYAVLRVRAARAKARADASQDGLLDPTTVLRLDAYVERPTAPKTKKFDPTTTQVYGRTNKEAAPRKREGESAPVEKGARLVGLSGSCKGRVFPLVATGITVGRNGACDIVLSDPRISSRHAWIGIVGGKVILRDEKSTNGTFLNAQINTSVSEVELRHNDTIFFGGHQGDQFRFVLD